MGAAGSQVHGLLLAREQAVGGGWHGLDVHLIVGLGEQLNNALVRRGHHALPVDLYDAVAHADAAAFSNAAPEKVADLGKGVFSEAPHTGSALALPSAAADHPCHSHCPGP